MDAITALHNIDENYSGRIDVFLNGDGSMVFQDNGIGLKEEEVYRFLTVIGESSKRDTPDADDFIGRFGIGLLSCFVVTNEIRVESRSAMGGNPVCWCGKVDGTYQTTFPDEEWEIGSRVVLRPKMNGLICSNTKCLKDIGKLWRSLAISCLFTSWRRRRVG